LIIDELEAELDDIKSGNKKINYQNNANRNFNNTGINTNRLKQLSVTLNNTSLINHLKKENERLRKLVVSYEFKNKRFFEEKKIKFKQNLININNHFYFSIINTPINNNTNTNNNNTNVNTNVNTTVNTNVNTNVNSNVNTSLNTNVNTNLNSNVNTSLNTNVNTNANTNANTNVNSNSMILINNNDENEKSKSTEKIKKENVAKNNKDDKKNNKEMKTKTCKRENKIYKLIRDINNYTLVNSNKNIDNNKQKQNINTGDYINIIDNDKKTNNNNIIMNKRNNIQKERTSSVIQRHKNTGINNINTKNTNYDNLTKKKLKSKNGFSGNNNNNKTNLANYLKNNIKDKSRESRNYSKGINKYFNKSFNESLIDQKYFNTMNKAGKKKRQNNHSNAIRIIDKERRKKELEDYSMNISKDYDYDDDHIIKKPIIKDIKSNQEDDNDNSDNDLALFGNKKNNGKSYYSAISNDYDTSNEKHNRINSDMRKKNSTQLSSNKKCEKALSSMISNA
jgi:hypothetical protein